MLKTERLFVETILVELTGGKTQEVRLGDQEHTPQLDKIVRAVCGALEEALKEPAPATEAETVLYNQKPG